MSAVAVWQGTNADVHRLLTETGAEITTTVTITGEHVTFDVTDAVGDIVCVNLTENETKALITSLVASLNAYQRGVQR